MMLSVFKILQLAESAFPGNWGRNTAISLLTLFWISPAIQGQAPKLDPSLLQGEQPVLQSQVNQIVQFGETELQFIGDGGEGLHITNLPIIRAGNEPVDPDSVRVEVRYVAMDGALDDPAAKAVDLGEDVTTKTWRSEPVDWQDQQQELLETTCAAPADSEVIGIVAVLVYGDTIQDSLLRGTEAYNQVLAERLALLLANTLCEEKFLSKPWKADASQTVGSQVKFENQRYHWANLEGTAQTDIVARVSFLRDGRDPVVNVNERANFQEAEVAPVDQPPSIAPSQPEELEPATVFEP